MSLLIIALSLSIDALGIGLSYGVRDIKIPFAAKSIICIFTAAITLIAVALGRFAFSLLPGKWAEVFGAVILCIVGVWIFRESKSDTPPPPKEPQLSSETLFRFVIEFLGISVEIIKNPVSGDRNSSKTIETKEAVYLGLALSLDSIGAGFACAGSGAGAYLIPLGVAVFHMIFLSIGSMAGKWVKGFSNIGESFWSSLSGCILIAIGVIRICHVV